MTYAISMRTGKTEHNSLNYGDGTQAVALRVL